MQVDDLPSYTVVVAATNHAELLDRAAWRRFQVRLALDPPNRNELTAYLARFADSCDESLGRSPATIAKRLGAISYAEAEEFCRDVRRHLVLAMGTKTLQAIVAERLKLWQERLRASANGMQRMAELPLLPIPKPVPDQRPPGRAGPVDVHIVACHDAVGGRERLELPGRTLPASIPTPAVASSRHRR